MPSIEDLWTPSDDLLSRDGIALEHVRAPHPRSDLIDVVSLPDVEDDDANEAAACLVLASLDDDDTAADEPGECDDDEQLDDPD
ncbi:MAG TPA: hypothetical protein VE645_19130 [Pseudonocardiaceae bacterium]|jgi:hypothetical protein|nr:hypothetical protein [Pseudonocardiaceae bacterium]